MCLKQLLTHHHAISHDKRYVDTNGGKSIFYLFFNLGNLFK